MGMDWRKEEAFSTGIVMSCLDDLSHSLMLNQGFNNSDEPIGGGCLLPTDFCLSLNHALELCQVGSELCSTALHFIFEFNHAAFKVSHAALYF